MFSPAIKLGSVASMRPASALSLSRGMASKIVATAFGPDRPGVLAEFTKTVLGHGGTLGGSRAVVVSGSFSVSAVVFLPEEDSSLIAALDWSLKTSLKDYLVAIRPALDANPPSVFARIEVLAADEISLITQLADHVGARGMSIQTLRTHHKLDGDGDDVYTAIATIATAKPKEEIDVAAVENEFYEMAEKLDVSIKFEHLA